MDVQRKNGAGRPSPLLDPVPMSATSSDAPSTVSQPPSPMPPSRVIRRKQSLERDGMLYIDPMSPMPTAAALLGSRKSANSSNLSVATLACPPSSLHPSILQRLELIMADAPDLSTGSERFVDLSAHPMPVERSASSASYADRYGSFRPQSALLPVASTPTQLLRLDGTRSMRRRTSETDAFIRTQTNASLLSDPHATSTMRGIPVTSASYHSDHQEQLGGVRRDKGIRFWSRLRRGRSSKRPPASMLTSAPVSVLPTPVPSPPLSLRSGRRIFSADLASSLSLGTSSMSEQTTTRGSSDSGKRSMRPPPPPAQRMSISLSAGPATPVKETSKIVKEYDPRTGKKMLNHYMVVDDLGRGVHGKVKLARDTLNGQACAIKIVDKSVRRRYRMSQYGRMSRNGFGGLSPSLVVAGSPESAVSLSPYSAGVAPIASGIPNSDQPHLDKIRREIAILKKCRHPNVVRLNEVIDDPDSRKIYLVLELLDGGEVRWRHQDQDRPYLAQPAARRVFRDVVLGLEYLHHQGIVHRDIKPANLLMTADSRTVKITDFGVSHLRAPRPHQPTTPRTPIGMTRQHSHRTYSSNDSHASLEDDEDADGRWADDEAELAKTVGSPAFFAPELCYTGDDEWASSTLSPEQNSDGRSMTGVPITARTTSANRPPVTKAIDVWALGVTLYCLIYGRCPFMAETEWELFNVIPRKELEFPEDVQVPEELRDLLQRLLTKDPLTRITLSEVKRHPWVVADLPDPEQWRRDTDPSRYIQVNVSDDEVKSAVTFKDRLRDQFRRLSNTLGLRRRPRNTPPVPSLLTDTSATSSGYSGR